VVGDIVQERRRPNKNLWKRAVKLEDEDDVMKRELRSPPPQQEEEEDDVGRAGLQTAEQVRAAVERRKRREREEAARHQPGGKEHETVYRDATGRRVDVSMKRAEHRAAAEAAKREADKAEEEKKQKEMRGGLAQQRAREAERERVANDASGFSRTRDDLEWNEELKARDRWDDPAAAFLQNKKDEGTKEIVGTGGRKMRRVVPVYVGAAPPNRYGIRPGYRWDGVDRSTGFEKTWFRKQNERRAEKEEWDRWEAGADD
jgi:pre-mRNA-splicing factor CWC26